MGDSDFVNQILSEAAETFENHHHLKYSGVDLEMVAQRVAHFVGLEVKNMWSARKYQKIIQARSSLCYWAVRELGESMAGVNESQIGSFNYGCESISFAG